MINYQELKKLGLTDKEAKIYLTSLQRGPETAPGLAKLAEVVRPTAYVVYDNLIKKGLMSTFTKGKKTFYLAEPPEHLVTLLRLQKQKIDETERELNKIIPELEAMSNTKGEKPKVRVFEGTKGLKAISEKMFKIKTKEVRSFIPLDEMFGLFEEKEHVESITKRRLAKKIKSKVLYTRKKGPLEGATNKKFLREAKHIPGDKYPLKAGIDIFEDSIAMYSFKGKIMGVFIENEYLAQTMKTIFDLCWHYYKEKK
jgi:sugar-specific transcriptional regulator TrmB